MTRASFFDPVVRAMLVGALISCTTPDPSPALTPTTDAPLVVGKTAIPASLISRVASGESTSAAEATRAIADDVLLANAAKARALDTSLECARATRSALARATLNELKRAATASPSTEAEISELSKERWRDVDLPETRVVVHAVVLRPKKETPESIANAKAFANNVHEKVANAATDAEFESLANLAPHTASEMVVERLPPFTSEGKMIDGGGELDATFVWAAFQLAAKRVSEVVETPFGWHVIWLNEVRPPRRLSSAEREALFRDEIVNRRVRREMNRILEEGKKRTPIEISGAAESILNDFFQRARAPE